MHSRDELLEELVESEHWAVLKEAAHAHALTYRNAALAVAESEWDFIVKERNAHTARAIPAFFTHIESLVRDNRKKQRGVQNEESLY